VASSKGRHQEHLIPTLGVWQGSALYVGAILGAGILILPGSAASVAGPASILAWAFDAILALPLALTFASLAARFRDAGGVATFAGRSFGATTGAVTGWLYFAAAATGQAIVPLTGAYYAASAIGLGRAPTFGLAALILAAGAAANLRGLRVSGPLQLALSGAVAGLLLLATVFALPHLQPQNFTPFMPQGEVAIGRAALLVFFAFFGWEAITHLAEEFRDPARDVPRATLLAVGLVTLLYLGLAIAIVGTATYRAPAIDRTAVASLLGRGLGLDAAFLAAGLALVISLGTVNAFVAATSRLGYALARDGSFPRPLARLDARGVPRVSVAAVALWAGVALGIAYAAGWGAEELLVVPNSLVLITYILGMAAALRLLSGRNRALAALALLLSLVLVPFAGVALVLPAVVALAAVGYRRWRGGVA
jgi:amino acid efflux transporter